MAIPVGLIGRVGDWYSTANLVAKFVARVGHCDVGGRGDVLGRGIEVVPASNEAYRVTVQEDQTFCAEQRN